MPNTLISLDFVCCFQYKAEAEQFYRRLSKRMENFGLELEMSKSRLIEFGRYAEERGYGVVRDLCGHGIGTALHEAPEIPNYEVGRKGVKLRPGMTLAIEPMINIGTYEVDWLDDDWTVVTRDGSLSAHYENTILITEGEPRILSLTCENE